MKLIAVKLLERNFMIIEFDFCIFSIVTKFSAVDRSR